MWFNVPDAVGNIRSFWSQDMTSALEQARITGKNPALVTVDEDRSAQEAKLHSTATQIIVRANGEGTLETTLLALVKLANKFPQAVTAGPRYLEGLDDSAVLEIFATGTERQLASFHALLALVSDEQPAFISEMTFARDTEDMENVR